MRSRTRAHASRPSGWSDDLGPLETRSSQRADARGAGPASLNVAQVYWRAIDGPKRAGPYASARVCTIYDNRSRPRRRASTFRHALARCCQVTHFHPASSRDTGRGIRSLYPRDDGASYVLPPRLRPVAWWSFDTHLAYDWDAYKARQMDWVFATQRMRGENACVTASRALSGCPSCAAAVHARSRQTRSTTSALGEPFRMGGAATSCSSWQGRSLTRS